MLQCFATLPTKLYPEASHVGHAGQSRIAILFSGGLLASFATKMAGEENLVVVDEQPDSQKGEKKKRMKEKRVWKDSKVETV